MQHVRDTGEPRSERGIRSGMRFQSHAETAARAARAATALRTLGIADDDTIALLLRNDFALFEATVAAGRLGAFATPINWHFTGPEVDYIIRDSGAKVLLAHADLYERVAASVPPDVHVILVPTPPEIRAAYALDDGETVVGDGGRAVRLWSALIDAHEPLGDPPRPPRLAMIYTSGTSGKPKGVDRAAPTPDELGRLDEARRLWWGLVLDEPSVVLVNGPMYHSATNGYGMAAFRMNLDIVLQARFVAEELLALVDAQRVSHMHIVPTMFVRLLRLPATVRDRYDVSSLRFVIHGAAPCPPSVKADMLAWWGQVIYEYYGSTEFGVATHITPEEALRKPGSVGRPLPGVRIAILDDAKRAVPPGEIGEIYVRSNAVPDFTYHGRPQSRAEIDVDGLVTCGDVGSFDPDGYLYLSDRKRDMVISAGVNVYPAEIEAALIAHPAVKDCAVFGLPDDEFGEALHACIEPSDPDVPFDEDDVRAFLEKRLARFKIPKHFEVVASLPREDSGKLFKRLLQAERRPPNVRERR